MTSQTIQILLATCLLSAFVTTSYGRYVIVGDPKSKDGSPWTHQGVNYNKWMKKNPLYVGDIAVFKYLAYNHLVALLPDKKAYDVCDYKNVKFIANVTAGVGKGFYVKVTSKPKYIGCMIFGHCEVGQKVIIVGKKKK